MIKIICDVCGKEILVTKHRKVLAYSQNSLEGRGYGNPEYFLKLVEVHPACAEEVERVIKEAVEKYMSRFST